MTINRRLLHWGLFFVTTGAVVLTITAGWITADGLATLFRLWPVLVIALGIGFLLRTTRLRAAGGMVLAVVPGLVLGGMLGAASLVDLPDWRDLREACVPVRPASLETREGTLSRDARVDLDLAWGELVVTTQPGDGWLMRTATAPGSAPDVDAGPAELAVSSATRNGASGWHWGACTGDEWTITLPTGQRLDLATEIGAGKGTLDLAGARLGEVDLVVQAAEAGANLGTATAEAVTLRVEAGAADLTLPATGDYAVGVRVDAGAARICAPDGLGMRVRSQGALAAISTPGLVRVGDAWETPGYATAINHADVTVAVNVGSVEINPEGGCK